MMKQIVKISFIFLLIVLIFFWLYMVNKEQREIQEVMKNCKTIKLGMSREAVKDIMGNPERITAWEYKGIIEECWYFRSSNVASEPPRCIFNKETGKVIEVVCGDNYRLGGEKRVKP